MKCVISIILNYNSKEETITLANQILDFTASDVLIIDNASNNNQFDELKNNRIHIIYNNKNLGYSGGNNIGLKYSIKNGYQYTWILNPDIEIQSETLELLIDSIENDNKIAAVGPRILEKDKSDIIYSDGGLLDMRNFKASHINTGKSTRELHELEGLTFPDYINGSCILIRNSALKKIGGFYEKFFMYYEETEWCFRAKKMGFKITVDTRINVYHERSIKGDFFYYYLSRNRSILSRIVRKDNHWANIMLKDLIKESIERLFKKKIQNPFFRARFKGALSGRITDLKDYNESISSL